MSVRLRFRSSSSAYGSRRTGLIVYNGDLAGRLTSIPADTWQMHELDEVVRRGQPLLNIFFSDDVEPNSQRDVSSMWASSKKP